MFSIFKRKPKQIEKSELEKLKDKLYKDFYQEEIREIYRAIESIKLNTTNHSLVYNYQGLIRSAIHDILEKDLEQRVHERVEKAVMTLVKELENEKNQK